MEERRLYPRVSLVVKVTNRSTREFHFFYSSDVSLGGIFLETREPYDVGTNVELDFFIPFRDKKERVVTLGEVARTVRYREDDEDTVPGMGVKFGELEPEIVAVISRYVREGADASSEEG